MSVSDPQFDWLVVGGGIHGTYVARELLESGVQPDALAVLDSHGAFCRSFRRKARACGMQTLRSNYVQHVGPSPFGLERFAEARDREAELVPTTNSQPRPTLDLFVDYTDHVIDRFDLDELLRKTTGTGIHRDGDALAVETTAGEMRAKNVVLAVGPGDRFPRPDWAGEQPRTAHVWDEQVPPAERIEPGETVWVVGGGITAGQFATSLAARAGQVVLCARHPLEVELREAEPVWLNWQHIAREIHSLPPGSSARYDRIREARNDGTIPPYLKRELDGTGNIAIRRDEIQEVVETGDRLLVSSRKQGLSSVDRIFLATGFESPASHPLVRSVADSLSLACGHQGMPVLDDSTLRWKRDSGSVSRVAVTGTLAAGTVGPFAGNIAGARRAAERIVATHPPQTTRQVGAVSD